MGIMKKQLDEFLNFSLKTIKKTEKITLKYFCKNLKHKIKKNKTPVTVADIKCENFIIEKINSKYPKHSLLTEETGVIDNGSDFKWIIDPLDGTKNYMRKYPFWGTLLALEWEGEVILGVISMPAIGETIYAVKRGGCFYNNRKAKVSNIAKLKDSYCLFGSLELIITQLYKNNFLNIISGCSYSRGFGDCHGHSFVINGRAEFMIDPHVAPYDVAATKICVEEAGGMFTDLNGNRNIYTGNALISNGRVHNEVLKMLNDGFESRDLIK
jgi:histidinol-phosphatase